MELPLYTPISKQLFDYTEEELTKYFYESYCNREFVFLFKIAHEIQTKSIVLALEIIRYTLDNITSDAYARLCEEFVIDTFITTFSELRKNVDYLSKIFGSVDYRRIDNFFVKSFIVIFANKDVLERLVALADEFNVGQLNEVIEIFSLFASDARYDTLSLSLSGSRLNTKQFVIDCNNLTDCSKKIRDFYKTIMSHSHVVNMITNSFTHERSVNILIINIANKVGVRLCHRVIESITKMLHQKFLYNKSQYNSENLRTDTMRYRFTETYKTDMYLLSNIHEFLRKIVAHKSNHDSLYKLCIMVKDIRESYQLEHMIKRQQCIVTRHPEDISMKNESIIIHLDSPMYRDYNIKSKLNICSPVIVTDEIWDISHSDDIVLHPFVEWYISSTKELYRRQLKNSDVILTPDYYASSAEVTLRFDKDYGFKLNIVQLSMLYKISEKEITVDDLVSFIPLDGIYFSKVLNSLLILNLVTLHNNYLSVNKRFTSSLDLIDATQLIDIDIKQLRGIDTRDIMTLVLYEIKTCGSAKKEEVYMALLDKHNITKNDYDNIIVEMVCEKVLEDVDNTLVIAETYSDDEFI